MTSEIADKDTKKGISDAAGPPEENLAFSVEWLDLSREVIEEKQKKYMARALENGELKNLKSLFLHNNAGDIGVRAMLNALQHSGLPSLEKLILWNVSSYDQITAAEEGTDTIAIAIENNQMPKLQTLDLTGSLPKLISPRSWGKVFGDFARLSLGEGRLRKFKSVFVHCCTCTSTSDPPGKSPSTLECCCHMCGNYIYSGNDGVKKIVDALRVSHPPLTVLNLRDNHIGDEGVENLAKLLSQGDLPLLEEVDLRNNPVSEVGEKRIVRAYLENPLLTASIKLDWSDPILKERVSAFREKNLRLEQRLKDPELVGINMEQGKISKSYKWNPDYSIRRPSKQKPYRFRMRCQTETHDHVTRAVNGAGAKGIPIKEKPLFSMPWCCSTPDRSRKLVTREYCEEMPEMSGLISPNQEEKSPANSMTVADGNSEERADEPSSLKCCRPSVRLLSLRRQQQPTTDNSIADKAPPVPSYPVEVAQTLSTTREESRPTSPERLPSLGIQQQPTADDSMVDTAPPIPPDAVAVAKTLSTTHEESRPTSAVRFPLLGIQQQPTADDSTAGTAPAVPRHSTAVAQSLATTHEESKPTSAGSLGIQHQPTTDNCTGDTPPPVPPDPVVGRKKIRISVTPGTRCFITAAKLLKEEEKTGWDRWDRWVRFPLIKRLPFIKLAKTERQIAAIGMELLMFADRKPREFQDMFGLTRVLLEDPAGCHYPAYICETCRFPLEEAGKSPQTVVKRDFLNINSQPSTASTAQPLYQNEG